MGDWLYIISNANRRPPFRGESEYLTFQQISEYVEHTFLYPDVLNQESKAIISSFLNKDK